jgi:hypothetical protein
VYVKAENMKPGYLAERFATIYKPKQPTKHEVVALRRAK